MIAAAVATCVPALWTPSTALATDPPAMAAPPQDQGLPYTRSAPAMAIKNLGQAIAVFPGSRYAYVQGHKIRLDNANWRDEAVLRDGSVYVPQSFLPVLLASGQSTAELKFDTAPAYLAHRWVYTASYPQIQPPLVKAVDIDGKRYIDLLDSANKANLKVTRHASGLILLDRNQPTLDRLSAAMVDSIITLFDTPEKFADPDIATKYIPTLTRQGKWTEHVKVTAEQLAMLNGPETQWPTAPKSQYDLTGFNAKLLGSKVPAPGVYPRVLFSPEDVPMLAERIKSSKVGQMSLIEMEDQFTKTWWNPTTSDGKIFQKLSTGDLKGLEWDVPPGTQANSYPPVFKGQKPGIFSSHVPYNSECLTAMALYCLVTNDDVHGKQAAAAIANYFKLREPLIDEINTITDSEYGSTFTRADGTAVPMNGAGGTTHARATGGAIAMMNVGMALDFAGKWMTADEKEVMRRVIAKSTYGRRAYGQDGPVRFRDVNWVGWDTPYFWGIVAIEGLEGFDREAYESNFDTVRGFCDWGIDDSGVVYESNGKTPGSFQSLTLSMIAMARRGENLWGHPHWRKLLTAQIQMTSPTGRVVVNSGTQYTPHSQQLLSLQFVDELKAFFPGDRRADYLLGHAADFDKGDEGMRMWQLADFNPETYRAKVASLVRLRLPSVTYSGFAHGVLYDTDYTPTKRAELNLPLDFNAPVHGVFSGYSDATPQATWINMMVRPDHYLGAGHHHADAGMFHFSALGVDWFTESQFNQNYDGKYHNQVLVDGVSEPVNMPGTANGYQAAATYLGATLNVGASAASADLTNSYTYRWLTQPAQVWSEEGNKMGWEMDPSPYIKDMFAGTARYKMRPWWANYTYVNYIATSRAKFNPMQYVYRTVGLVRGEHPYGIVVDDAKKDDQSHLYQWTAMLNGGVWQADVAGLAKGQTVLAIRKWDPKAPANRPLIKPEAGESLLLVCPVGLESGDASLPLIQVSTEEGPADRNDKPTAYDRIAINHRSTDAAYRVLLVPFRYGEPLPQIAYDPAKGVASIQNGQQVDQIAFKIEADHRTRLSVSRNGSEVLSQK